jgi:hypothetical protein
MTQIGFNKIVLKGKEYVKQNWGSPFIIGFMLFLVIAAVSISVGWSSLADTVVFWAFCSLVAGVSLQLASYLKYCGKSDNDEVPL